MIINNSQVVGTIATMDVLMAFMATMTTTKTTILSPWLDKVIPRNLWWMWLNMQLLLHILLRIVMRPPWPNISTLGIV
jgi:hypothetical protein